MDSNICNIMDELAKGNPDTHFSVYHELMGRKIHDILLVASPYDAYVLEEDGSLASKIIHEYNGLNLSRPPRMFKAATAADALCLLDDKRFDMVIVMPNLADMDPSSLAARIKEKHPATPVIELVHGLGDMAALEDNGAGAALDDIFVWTGDADLLLALVKNAEDRLNVAPDTKAAEVRVLILVEDAPFYRSIFLPLIYREVVRQTQVILEEGLNEEHRLLKMRARPKILVADNYEAAFALYWKYRPYVFGVLSDTRFPKDGRITADAGISLLKEIKADIPHLPVLLLSAEGENREKAKGIPAVFVDKNSPKLMEDLHRFFLNYLGFGDFVFRLPDRTEIGRADNLKALEELLPHLPDEPVLYEAGRNRFSNWFMARTEIKLASALARLTVADFPDVPKMKSFIASSIRQLRKSRQQGVVAAFNPADFDPGISDFVKIGNGSLGGKARGLAFLANLIRQHPDFIHAFEQVDIAIPGTLVIATDGYDEFITENGLETVTEQGLSDEEIATCFLKGHLPRRLAGKLTAYLRRVAYPLSVRSSGLMEDAHFFPYAGVYKTYMLPNNHPDFNIRFAHLEKAVKLVYASTCFEGTRRYSKSVSQQFRKDSMAVIVQNLSGGVHNGYFYPAISGVARSTNFYLTNART